MQLFEIEFAGGAEIPFEVIVLLPLANWDHRFLVLQTSGAIRLEDWFGLVQIEWKW